jgi:hypothetical protein
VSSFTSNSLQKATDQIARFFKEWNVMKCNLNKPQITVFVKHGKFRKSKKWNMCGHNIDVIGKFIYSGITLENRGGWNKQKTQLKAKSNGH